MKIIVMRLNYLRPVGGRRGSLLTLTSSPIPDSETEVDIQKKLERQMFHYKF